MAQPCESCVVHTVQTISSHHMTTILCWQVPHSLHFCVWHHDLINPPDLSSFLEHLLFPYVYKFSVTLWLGDNQVTRVQSTSVLFLLGCILSINLLSKSLSNYDCTNGRGSVLLGLCLLGIYGCIDY